MAFPTTTAPTLANWELQYNGLNIGATTTYDVTQIDGLDLPTIRNGDVVRPRDHGELIGLDFMGGRDVTLTADFVSDGTSLQHAAEALASAFAVGLNVEQPLWIQIPNLPCLAMMARTRKRTVPIDLGYSVSALATTSILMHSTDPRLYTTPTTATVGLPAPLGGLTFNATPNFTFGGGGTYGSISATNSGNVEMRPTFTITGPVTAPVVQNVTTGWILTFTNPSGVGYTLNAGDTLTVDTDLRTVLYTASGSTSPQPRRNWLTAGSIWPDPVRGIAGLAPGGNGIEFSSADSSAVSGTLSLSWASAYLI